MTTGTDIQLYHRIGEGGQLSGLDSRLLGYAAQRMSMEQMYEELGRPGGLTPARLGQRVREILRSQDWLSITDQKALILLDFIRLRDTLFDRVEGTETRITKHGEVIDVESSSGWANALIRLLKEWAKILDSMQADINADRLLIRAAHAKIMMDALIATFERFVLRLEKFFEDYKRLPTRIEMDQILEDVLPYAFGVLEEKTAPE